jgi:hypothetical protein
MHVDVSGVDGAAGLAVGSGTSCVILGDHSARCWGAPDVGDGTTFARLSPVTALF